MSVLRNPCRNSIRALAVATLAIVVGAGAVMADAPVKVGELEFANIASPHPYPQGVGLDAREWTIHYPGATYIRVYFNEFDLAPGDWVEVSNLDMTRMDVYEGKGPHGDGHFWAFAIPGDTAVIRLQAQVGGGFGLQADRFGRGTVPFFDEPSPDSVCGTQDWQDVECYRSSYPTEFEKARGAVKALIGAGSACTAFRVSDSGQFMTNNHCTSTASGVKSTELQFEYQRPGCNSGTASSSGSVMGDLLLRTDYTLDYTLFTTTGDSSAIPCLEIDNRLAPEGERIYIAGHPSAGPKKLSIESDWNNGLCQVDDSPHPGRDNTSDIGYYCDTTNGSSGSPVLSGDTHKVVAIHHFGGCLNSGARMDRIYNQISGLLDSCGGGEPPVCGNGVKESGEDCDGSDLGGATCQSLGWDDGTLACDGNCDYDTTGCFNYDCLPRRSSCTSNAECCSGECKIVKKGGFCK